MTPCPCYQKLRAPLLKTLNPTLSFPVHLRIYNVVKLVDRIWLWVYYNKTLIYPIFYLPKGDYKVIWPLHAPCRNPPIGGTLRKWALKNQFLQERTLNLTVPAYNKP